MSDQEIQLTSWQYGLYGVVSLFDLKQFFADVIDHEMGAVHFAEAKLGWEKDENPVVPAALLMLYAKLNVLGTLLADYGLKSSSAQCMRVVQKIDQKTLTRCGELRESLKQLRERYEDELKAAYFLHLDPKQADQYQDPLNGWEVVTRRFSKAKHNVEESGRCFALERYPAAVFHVLQVAEYGVIQLANLLEVSGDKPGWGSLKRLSGLIAEPFPKRSQLAQKHSKLLEDTVPLAIVVKDNWRHKLEHVDNQIVWIENDFSSTVAAEIISAVRAFMRKVASELPQTK